MKSLNQYIKQNAQKDIIARFDELYEMGLEANRNKEWWDTFFATKTEALIRDLRCADLDKFLEPLYNTLNDDNLKSAFSKEQREANSAIWDNEEMKIKREAHKGQLNFRFRKFMKEARESNCNDEFIEQIKARQFECFKHAFGLAEIDREIEALRKTMLESRNQLNDNQKLTKSKFDKIINDLIEAQKANDIAINVYNSGDYNDKDSSLWTQIFELKNGAISNDVEQEIVDTIIADFERTSENLIKKLLRDKEISAMKKAVNLEARQEWLNSLSDRQKAIYNEFCEIQGKYAGKYNKAFWDEVIKPLRDSAIALEVSDETLNEYFRKIEIESQNEKYQKKQA